MTSSILLYRCGCKQDIFFFLAESLCSLGFRCSPCLCLVTLCVARDVFFAVKKNKTWSRVKAGIYYAGKHPCSLELTPSTLIPCPSCSPLPLRKFNPLPCHCYTNLWLLDTHPSMTVTQNRCHTHLGQAVLQRYVFIPCCRADFQSSFPFAAARGWASRGRRAGRGMLSGYGFSRPAFLFSFSPRGKILCWWLQPPSVL